MTRAGLCQGGLLSRAFLSRGSLSRGGLCPGGLCIGVSVWGSLYGGLCLGVVSVLESLSGGGGLCQGDGTVKSGRYASYWNVFLFILIKGQIARQLTNL